MPFSIVVVTWHCASELRGLLESAGRHLSQPHEFVIVDNGSGDETLAVAHGLSRAEDQVLGLGRNLGFGAASNAGVRSARSEVVVLLNPDCLLIDGSLGDLASLAGGRAALCGAALLNPDRTRQISTFPRPASWEQVMTSFWPGALMPSALRRRCEPWRFDEERRVGWVSAACVAARRDLLLSLGPFDERLAHYGEDIDLGLRASSRGIRCLYVPQSARVVHLGGRSAVKGFDDAGMRRKIEARRWVARRHFGPFRAALDSWLQLAFFLNRFLLKLVLRRQRQKEWAWLRAAARLLLRRRVDEGEGTPFAPPPEPADLPRDPRDSLGRRAH